MVDLLRFVTEAALASPWLLAVILVLSVLDALAPVVPAEALIIGAGVAAATGEQDLLAVIAVAALGAFVGETIGYLIGRGVGPGLRGRLAPGGARAVAFDRVAGLIDRRGGTVLLTARFIPAGRTVATLAAGATSFPVPRFLGFTAAGSVLSAAYQALIGFLGGAAFADDTLVALLVSLGLGTLLTVVLELVRRAGGGSARAPGPVGGEYAPQIAVTRDGAGGRLPRAGGGSDGLHSGRDRDVVGAR